MSKIVTPAISCLPDLHETAKHVLNGEYDIPQLEFASKVHILDIGANCGSFAAWAEWRFQSVGTEITCYEPLRHNYEQLKFNRPNDELVMSAVSDYDGKATLHLANGTSAMCSLVEGWTPSASTEEVDVISAAHLPPCDLLKIDTEGSELPILRAYQHLGTVKVVLVEWHSSHDRYRIGSLLLDAGLSVVGDAAMPNVIGIIKAVRSKNFNETIRL